MNSTLTTEAPQTALRYLELVRTRDDGPAVESVIHPEYIHHRFGLRGPDGFRELVRRINVTFADVSVTVADVIADGDRVAARTRMKALHVGPFQDHPASNRTIEVDQVHIWRLEDGLVAEHWFFTDEMSLLRQIGALS
jgi:steroid delta-isomerase-like uncharacterized protein